MKVQDFGDDPVLFDFCQHSAVGHNNCFNSGHRGSLDKKANYSDSSNCERSYWNQELESYCYAYDAHQ